MYVLLKCRTLLHKIKLSYCYYTSHLHSRSGWPRQPLDIEHPTDGYMRLRYH